MGRDSYEFEKSLLIRNLIADEMLSPCACELYKGFNLCLRCDTLEKAERLFPVEYMKAANSEYIQERNGN